MNQFFKDVIEFNRDVLKIEQRDPLELPYTFDEKTTTINQLTEELTEFLSADGPVESVDALIDLMYFATGAMYKMGMTAEQIDLACCAVHRANMTKAAGKKNARSVGDAVDAVKPADFVGPEQEIHDILFEGRL